MAPLAESIFITGANRGIGLEIVKQLVRNVSERPKHIFATCRDINSATELQALANEFDGLHILPIKDVRDYSSYPKIVKTVNGIVGEHGLNLLINNAGIGIRSSLTEVTRDEMMEAYEINAVAPLLLTQALLPLLKCASLKFTSNTNSCSRATVINITSQMGSITTVANHNIGGCYPYRASKTALNMVSQSMSVDLKDDNILVCVIHPGWVKTDMGGSNAPTNVNQCVKGMLLTLSRLTKEDNGTFLNHDGTTLPW